MLLCVPHSVCIVSLSSTSQIIAIKIQCFTVPQPSFISSHLFADIVGLFIQAPEDAIFFSYCYLLILFDYFILFCYLGRQ